MKKNSILPKTISYASLFTFSIMVLVPFFWLIRSSLMEMSQTFQLPTIWLPNPLKFENYMDALTILPFHIYLINTLTIIIFGVSGVILTSSFCAYSLSRIKWFGRDILFAVILSSMMLPYAVTLIPTFIGWKSIGLTNTLFPLIIPCWFGGGAFNIFLLRQFCLTIPKELDEAAYVDGIGHLRIFFQIIIPLSKPALVVVALFSFLFTWNDFLGPLVFLTNEKKYTLALGLQLFQGSYYGQWNLLMAATTVVILPAIIVFLAGQKYFVEGITMTGLKG